MKKTGLAIVTYGTNYGTYLQAFATQYMINKMCRYGDEFAERIFNRNYSSAAYGFNIKRTEDLER